jgi:2-polyprenyl-6-hydroxyphenyl methylase/3-demethylubiquinone-9 3-methyltransferase
MNAVMYGALFLTANPVLLKMPSTVRPEEIARFSALASSWWDENGPMRPLHRLNPSRLSYIERCITAHFGKPGISGITLLDVGCAAGLVSENLAKKGAVVTGIDASDKLIGAATEHAAEQNVAVTYRNATLEQLADEKKSFDVVLALEVIEHTADAHAFVELCAGMVKKGGLVIFSTLNRTPKSFALGIIGAEYILRWLPAGTHDWKSFVKPSELAGMAEQAGLKVQDICGLVYNPISDSFSLNARDVGMNYFLTAAKP